MPSSIGSRMCNLATNVSSQLVLRSEFATLKEVEVKIVDIDREKVESRLRSLGATRTLDGDQVTVFFDFPDNSIAAAKNLLRLRKTADKTMLTFKKFVASKSAKVRDEYEVVVSDFESMQLILESLGLSPTMRMEKHRTSYKLTGGVEVDIDKYSGEYSHIPELLEIEGHDAETVHLHAKLLGFQLEECKSWTTFDLIDYYSGKKAER
jgi:adenylate cyclase class 2